ncbi:MAG TPA: cytochrome b5 domain-containing protein [Candidatus Paceibacterota bacterium]
MLIYYPTYFLVPVAPIMSLDEDEYRYNLDGNAMYNTYGNMNKGIFKDNFEEIDKRQQKFTLEELSKYNGIGGKAAYVAINGIVYDVSSIQSWAGGVHHGVSAGSNATEYFNTCHGDSKILDKLPKIGVVTG